MPSVAAASSGGPSSGRPSLRILGSSLRGDPFSAADWPILRALFEDPRAGRWLMRDPSSVDLDAHARRVASRFAESWAADGFGPYLLRLGARPIGYAGLRRSRLDARLETEALYAILPEHQGAGRATAALAAALRQYDVDDPNAPRVASWTLPENAASLRVLDKLGFLYERDAIWAGLRHVVYRLPSEARARAGAA